MKTSKQLSQEVLEKIAHKNEERAKMKKRLQKAAVAVVIVGVLIPTSVYLGTTEKFDKNTPLSKPLEQSEQLPSSSEEDSEITQGEFKMPSEAEHIDFM
jgi:hypothetical protein